MCLLVQLQGLSPTLLTHLRPFRVRDPKPQDAQAYASHLSREITSTLGAAMVQQAPSANTSTTADPASPAAAAEPAPSHLPTLVHTVMLEGCVQVAAWAAGAPSRHACGERPMSSAGTPPGPESAQSFEQGVLESLLAGSSLLRAAGPATLQAGNTVAVVGARAGAPSFAPLSMRLGCDGVAREEGGCADLQLLHAWPVCLPISAPSSTLYGGGAPTQPPICVEVCFAPARVAAAAGVKWLVAHAVLSDGSRVLLDEPLVLDAACPVARCAGLGFGAGHRCRLCQQGFDAVKNVMALALGPISSLPTLC
jgi:hypothetical protein